MNTTRSDNLPLAISVILLSVLGLSLGDALIKFTSGEFVMWQIFVIRSLIVLPLLLAYLAWRMPSALRHPPALGWTTLRSLMMVAMWIAYYFALPHLDIAVAAAAYYTLPIFITLFSALLIGDRIRPLGWIAVALGFAGVMLILRPRAGDFNLFALLPLLSAVLYALAMILTRTKCREAHPILLAAGLNAGFIVVGAIAAAGIALLGLGQETGFMLGPWSPMGQAEWLSMGLLAAAILLGSVGAAIAYQNGPPAVVGIFDFAYVGFAVIWGAVLLSELPDAITLGGIALIVLAGILSLRQ
ncbi:MAG: DMT family transporter [Pseudomonadota bacterium]